MFEVLACWRPHAAGAGLQPSPHTQCLLLRLLPEVTTYLSIVFRNICNIRLIFELPPTILDGSVTATNIAGVKRKLFRNNSSVLRIVPRDGFISRIVLLSQARTEALLSNQTITGLNIDNLNIEEIRKLREELDRKERKRVRERDKVLGFVIGMIIPIGLILYITLNISCRFDHQKVLTLTNVCSRQSNTAANMFGHGN